VVVVVAFHLPYLRKAYQEAYLPYDDLSLHQLHQMHPLEQHQGYHPCIGQNNLEQYLENHHTYQEAFQNHP